MKKVSCPHFFELLLLLAAVVWFYPRVGLPGWISPGGDVVNLMLPAREWAGRWLGRGVVPLWNPQTFGGAPFLAAMQPAVFYPPNLVLGAFLSPLATINILRLFHIYLFGALTWGFLRFERGHCAAAALLGGLAVAGSAHVASHTDHVNQLAAIAWLPALVACQWRFWRTGRGAALLALAAVLALQILAGHPQAVFYSLLLSAAIAAAWLLRNAEWGMRNAEWGMVVAAVAGGFLLAAIQLVPTGETARMSRRSVDGPEYPWFGAMPRHFAPEGKRDAASPEAERPRRVPFWWAMISPGAFNDPATGLTHPDFGGESVAFFGRTTLLLALVAVVVGVASRRWFAVFWLVVVVAAFVLALGPYGPFCGPGRPSPVFQAYLWLLPPARHLRVPPRILLLATFAMGVLGAEGLNRLWRLRWWASDPRRRGIRLLACWGAVAILTVELWAFQRPGFHNRPVRHYPIERLLDDPAREALAALLPASTDEAALPDFRVFRLMIHDPDYLMDARPAAVRNRYRRVQPNLGMLLGVAEVEGYEEGLLPPARYFDFLFAFNGHLMTSHPDAVLLALMNVRYLYADYNLPVGSAAWRPVGEAVEPSLTPGEPDRRYRLYENPLWLPRVVWTDWLPADIAPAALRGSLSRGGPPLRERIKQRRDYGAQSAALEARGWLVERERLKSLRVRVVSPNRIQVDNSTRRGGTLFVSQNAYPGWLVDAGGQTVALRPLTDFAGAASVSPGAERLEIVYRPFSFRVGAYLSAVAAAAWLALAIAACGRRRNPKTQ